jgi:hypothetical protein
MKKALTYISFVVIMTMLATMMSACGNSKGDLSGTYKCGDTFTITFSTDGTCSWRDVAFNTDTQGTYKKKGDGYELTKGATKDFEGYHYVIVKSGNDLDVREAKLADMKGMIFVKQ